MTPRRSVLLHGLRLVVAHPGALLWTYAFNLGIALLFSVRVHAQFSDVLNHSLAAERLNTAFDAGTLVAAIGRVWHDAPSSGSAAYLGLPLYLAVYFLLVPGTLFCYQSGAPAKLRTLLSMGLSFFWRFIRITLLTLVLFAAILGPLFALESAWSRYVDLHATGMTAIYEELPGIVLLMLVAALLRLYCDLVEVYTVERGEDPGLNAAPSGSPDRRIRKALLPALRTLRQNFFRAYGGFLLLALGGLTAVFLTGRVAVHMLAQPRVWPMFLLAQLGVFLLLASRNWQRGAECALVLENPSFARQPLATADPVHHHMVTAPTFAAQPGSVSAQPAYLDAQPDPEPAAPSLLEPDPAVFERELELGEARHGPSGRSDPNDIR